MSQALTMLIPIMNSPYKDLPLSTAIERLGYGAGFSTSMDDLIAKLELGKVANAASILRGSSRSIQALTMAQQHLPDPKKDSSQLMYNKLQSARQYIQDIQDNARNEMQRYPGLKRSESTPGGPITPPPAASVAGAPNPAIDALVKKYGGH
jgi:hypothetical protein